MIKYLSKSEFDQMTDRELEKIYNAIEQRPTATISRYR